MTTITWAFAFAFGACVGSFLNVCIYRLPRSGLSVSRPRRSFCPSCGTAIRPRDNIPLVSWLWLRGRCIACRSPISSRYFLVELFTAVVFVYLADRFLLPPGSGSPALFAVLAALVSALIVASFIDLELRIIPDAITIRGMMVAPLLAVLVPELHPEAGKALLGRWLRGFFDRLTATLPFQLVGPGLWALAVVAGVVGFALGLFGYLLYQRWVRPSASNRLKDGILGAVLLGTCAVIFTLGLLHPEWVLAPWFQSFWAAIAGMLVGSTLLLSVGVLGSKIFRKPAMGFGDVKLMGLLGAFAGWVGVIAGFFLACFLGSVVGIVVLLRSRSRYIPFGPFLAVGSLAWMLWPSAFQRILDWYLGLFR